MNFSELNQRYMELQSIPFTRITIKEREEFQYILKLLIDNPETSEHDLDQYYLPRYRVYESDIKQVKQCIDEQIAFQEAIIGIAQNKIDNIKMKLGQER